MATWVGCDGEAVNAHAVPTWVLPREIAERGNSEPPRTSGGRGVRAKHEPRPQAGGAVSGEKPQSLFSQPPPAPHNRAPLESSIAAAGGLGALALCVRA